ncbi:DUF3558 domain-containing protein [Streptomyces sp. SID13031]|uniref:DUF3558 domain-containing protein n=1 Tax=Streptomyces sp. SID13031 TaxID=2706046 RepID=UPI0013C6696A|nr:DUF3558 domain-containing protein [Streptomyces sp. SID13031]NEA36138.1 DUF3558 domain-containing protein [Streptomyces sp. SID13031]
MLTVHRGRLVTVGASVLLAGAFALTVAGCGPADADKAAAPPPTTPTSQPSDDPGTPTAQPTEQSSGDPTTPTPTGEAAGEAGDLPNPCEGFTEAGITTWTGLPIAPDEDGFRGGPDPYEPGDTQRECVYGLKGGHFLVGAQHTSADEFSPPGDDGELVDGIGDQAFFIKSNNELHVRKGELEIVVNFTKDSSPSGDLTLIPVQKTIATAILEKTGA